VAASDGAFESGVCGDQVWRIIDRAGAAGLKRGNDSRGCGGSLWEEKMEELEV
jgi:hypothetical protein